MTHRMPCNLPRASTTRGNASWGTCRCSYRGLDSEENETCCESYKKLLNIMDETCIVEYMFFLSYLHQIFGRNFLLSFNYSSGSYHLTFLS